MPDESRETHYNLIRIASDDRKTIQRRQIVFFLADESRSQLQSQISNLKSFKRGRSSVGRAPQWHCGGQGFESPRLQSPCGVEPKSNSKGDHYRARNPLGSSLRSRRSRERRLSRRNFSEGGLFFHLESSRQRASTRQASQV
jgi:hypothetical protein